MSVATTFKTMAALALAGLAAACGFSPIYADRGTGLMQNLSSIEVAYIESETEAGYVLQSELQRRINTDAGKDYLLEVDLAQKVQSEAITRQADTVRYSFKLHAAYRLLNTDGETLLAQSRATQVSYGVAPSQYATEIAQEEALRNAAQELADQIELDLVIFFKNGPSSFPTPSTERIDPFFDMNDE